MDFGEEEYHTHIVYSDSANTSPKVESPGKGWVLDKDPEGNVGWVRDEIGELLDELIGEEEPVKTARMSTTPHLDALAAATLNRVHSQLLDQMRVSNQMNALFPDRRKTRVVDSAS